MFEDNGMGGLPDPSEVGQPPKRQRLGDSGVGGMGGEGEGPSRQLATPEDQGGETQERVPIPRSSL